MRKEFLSMVIIIVTLAFSFLLFQSCERPAQKISYNLSYEADNFKVKRRVIFFNGITDKILLEIIGYCSIEKDNSDEQLEVTCKIANNKYRKHYFGLSDNCAYFVEQLNPKDVSEYYYKVNFRPQAIIPSIDIKMTTEIPIPNVKIDH